MYKRQVRDFHPLERAHGAQTKKAPYCYDAFVLLGRWSKGTLFHYLLYFLDVYKRQAYDRYPWEYNTFILDGDVILIENDLLADALNALPQDNRDILLMYWFLEMADREIAERMNLARKTINNRRLKSYRLLKELMGGDTDA